MRLLRLPPKKRRRWGSSSAPHPGLTLVAREPCPSPSAQRHTQVLLWLLTHSKSKTILKYKGVPIIISPLGVEAVLMEWAAQVLLSF